MRRAWVGAVVCAALLAVPASARANGRFPASNQIIFSPASASTIAVRTTFGLIMSTDSGATWRWLCEDALGLGPTSNEDPYLAYTANGTLLAGLSLGLETSTNGGCGWTFAGGALHKQFVKDVDVRKDNQHIVDLITSQYGTMANVDGGAGYTQQVYESTDDGTSWSAVGTPIDPSIIVTTIDIAPSDPNRIYVSAFRPAGMQSAAWLYVSKDKGTTWTVYDAPLDPATETAVYIGAVDPTQEDVVYLRSEGQSRLSVTRDGGQTITPVKTLDDEMLGLALSPDGSKIYIGSVTDGLLVAPTATMAFTQTSQIHVQCLVTNGADLWACSDEVSGFVAGVSTDDGKTFTPKLHLLSIVDPIACPSGSTASACTTWNLDAGNFYNPFVDICSNLGACFDAGPPEPLMTTCACTGACAAFQSSTSTDYVPSAKCPDGGSGSGSGGSADGGAAGGGGSKSSCGCSAVGGGGALGALASLAGAGALALALRRRRSRGARR